MPITQTGNPESVASPGVFVDAKIEYDYPAGLDLHPDSKLHEKLVDMILRHAQESNAVMSRRHSSWMYGV